MSALPLLVRQSLELWRAPLQVAVHARDAAPLLARARSQLAAGAAALDLNVGIGAGDETAEALRWAGSTLQRAGVTVPLWLDCGDTPTLTRVLAAFESTTHPPLVANAARIEGAREPATLATHELLDACSRAGAAVVCSPHFADDSLGIDAILEAHADAHSLVRTYGLHGAWYLDCLAYPPALDPARAARSLGWLRALRMHTAREGSLRPLVAVGNVGHGVQPALRAPLRRAYAAAAVRAGACALTLPVEDAPLHAAVGVADGVRAPLDATEAWWLALAQAARGGAPLPPPVGSDDAALHAVWSLLIGA
jgi:hypothetical protein